VPAKRDSGGPEIVHGQVRLGAREHARHPRAQSRSVELGWRARRVFGA
jgi:hypothetical protein